MEFSINIPRSRTTLSQSQVSSSSRDRWTSEWFCPSSASTSRSLYSEASGSRQPSFTPTSLMRGRMMMSLYSIIPVIRMQNPTCDVSILKFLAVYRSHDFSRPIRGQDTYQLEKEEVLPPDGHADRPDDEGSHTVQHHPSGGGQLLGHGDSGKVEESDRYDSS